MTKDKAVEKGIKSLEFFYPELELKLIEKALQITAKAKEKKLMKEIIRLRGVIGDCNGKGIQLVGQIKQLQKENEELKGIIEEFPRGYNTRGLLK